MGFDLAWIGAAFGDLRDFAPLTAGGQKEVFVCLDAGGDEVMLKLFHPGRTEPDRVLREVRAPAALGAGIRVPQVLDAGVRPSPTGDVVYLIEQRIPGNNLRERLARGTIRGSEVMPLTRDVLEVLVRAETVPLVHRDIKPENILMATDGRAWVLDFGIARFLAMDSLTATVRRFGLFTPGYAPPEQFNNSKAEIDVRADLFALGVTSCECLTGLNPFRDGARSDVEILSRVESQQMGRVPNDGTFPESFGDLLEAMTRTRASHRPRTAAECLVWVEDSIAEAGGST